MRDRVHSIDTKFGKAYVAFDKMNDYRISLVSFDKKYRNAVNPHPILTTGMYIRVRQIAEFIDDPNRGRFSDDKICFYGTEFQENVWSRICEIPRGQTKTYKQIAEEIGHPTSYRAVANACGQNRLAILIPCHRVVAKSGLGGYRWGSDMKKRLLNEERRDE